MATGKRYYWMKLKESFMTSDTIDYFMSQPDGANYVVLYQMLCLKTINTDGRLSRQIGEIIIPFDVEKIQRDCKWFSIDTIRVALNLYRQVGLIYEDVDGTLVMTDHENLVGSETDWADKKKRQRSLPGGVGTLSPPMSPECPPECPENVPIDIRDRDKSIENRGQSLENRDIETDTFPSSGEDGSCDSELTHKRSQRQIIKDAWNSLEKYGIRPIKTITDGTQRAERLRARLREHGLQGVLEAIDNIRLSNFLTGKNDTGWVITFDWFILPNNFPKVHEGNYDNRSATPKPSNTSKRSGAISDLMKVHAMFEAEEDDDQ